MEENGIFDNEYEYRQSVRCVRCGSKDILEDSPNKLCKDCRSYYIKYPIPKWIWTFAACVLAIMIIGFARTGKSLNYSFSVARAEKAMREHRYMTAAKEYHKLLKRFPNDLTINANLFVAAAYNHDLAALRATYDKISGREMDDEALFNSVTNAMNFVEHIINIDSFTYARFAAALPDSIEGMERFVAEVDTSNAIEDKQAAYVYAANQLFDYNAYDQCEHLLQRVLHEKSDNYTALSLMSAVKRNMGHFDEAMVILDGLLKMNQEDIYVLAQMCRTRLKQGKDAEASRLAARASKIDPDNISVMEAQAMVDFYTGRKDKSLALLKRIKTKEIEEGDSTISVRLGNIIAGKEQFR